MKSQSVVWVSRGDIPENSFNIVLTDTSTEYPTSWSWKATNLLGNNTEFEFSTDQNPILNLERGNWILTLTATNGIGAGDPPASRLLGLDLNSPRVYFWSRES